MQISKNIKEKVSKFTIQGGLRFIPRLTSGLKPKCIDIRASLLDYRKPFARWWGFYSRNRGITNALFSSKWAASWKNQQCGFWPGLTQTRLYSYWRWLEAWNFVFRKKRYCTIQVAKTKALISFCVFVFAYADCWFFHDAAQMFSLLLKYLMFILIWNQQTVMCMTLGEGRLKEYRSSIRLYEFYRKLK